MANRFLARTVLAATMVLPAAAQDQLRFFNVSDATATALWEPGLEA